MADIRVINGVISYPLKSGSAPEVINGVIYNWEAAAVLNPIVSTVWTNNPWAQIIWKKNPWKQ